MSDHLDEFDIDPTIDQAFSDLLEDVGDRTNPPPASSIIGRARRRRTTIVAAAAAVVLIAGAATFASGVGRPTAEPGPAGQLPTPQVLDRDSWAAATAGWIDGWKEPSDGDSLAWVDKLQDPSCLASMPDTGPEPDRTGNLTLASGSHAVAFGALADFDDPTKAQTTWRHLSGAISGCADAALLHRATWDGAEAESYSLDSADGSDYFWLARTGQSMAFVWVAGDGPTPPDATDTQVMTALVAGLRSPESFARQDSVSTGSASGSASMAAVPEASVVEGDFAQALGTWDSGWERRGDKITDVTLPCLALDSAPNSSGGFGSSVGTNGGYSVSLFTDDSTAADAYASALTALRSCSTAYSVDTIGSSPQVAVASTDAGVAWIVRTGANIGVISVQGGHADPPTEVSAAVGDLIDRALRTTTP